MSIRPPISPRRSETAPATLLKLGDGSGNGSSNSGSGSGVVLHRSGTHSRSGSRTKANSVAGPSRNKNGTSTSASGARAPRPISTVSDKSQRLHPLLSEIERLTAACEEHERKIRATRASIEHRLFNEMPHILTRLNGVDDEADAMTAQIQSTIQSVKEPLKERLDSIVKSRERDVETMRSRTTPWRTFFDEDETQNGDSNESSRTGKIARIPGISSSSQNGGVVKSGVDGNDALVRIERWAEEVELYLSSEIIRLKAALSTRSKRRSFLHGLLALLLAVVVVLIGVGWAASQRWG